MRTLDATEKRVNDLYLEEPWGKLLTAFGFLPYDTESSAREVARRASIEIQSLTAALQAAREHLEYCGYGDSWERQVAKESKISALLDVSLKRAEEIGAQLTPQQPQSPYAQK